ncbi:MAG: lysine 2,3-aminomutase YodO family protein [uncultured bacterium]|nr:MAG: lysine 2,3-aminomutase YodO family protein [uncultured bacterium]
MVTDTKKLSQRLQLNLAGLKASESFADFPLQVPESFVARIKPGDINDPLLLQVLPQEQELQETPGFVTDPLAEKNSSPVPGVIHKYLDRVLLLVSDVCAINCRFCFRRHSQDKISDWQKVFAYIKRHPDISEIILSGGDPLMLEPNDLIAIIEKLAEISHIKRLRIHSRTPIVMPERVLPDLTQTRLPIILVVHCNHPNEINADVEGVISALRHKGIIIFNQSVLLRGINDNADVLIALSEKLFNAGVLPYYLHMLDQVKGAAHFYVEKDQAKQIYLEMQKRLPGYLVPKLVFEVQGRKTYV